eukprot:3163670-Pyramimonas_sp.AAC.1
MGRTCFAFYRRTCLAKGAFPGRPPFPVKAQSQLQLIHQDLPHPPPDDPQLPAPLHDVLGGIILELQPLRRRGAVKSLKRII